MAKQRPDQGAGPRESWPQGIWAAVPTPFGDDLSLDAAGIRRNVARFRSLGLAGIFCNGLMGEGWSLDLDDRRRVVDGPERNSASIAGRINAMLTDAR